MVSTEALRLRYLPSGEQCRFRSTKLVKDFACDEALQAPDDLSVAFSLFLARADVGRGGRVVLPLRVEPKSASAASIIYHKHISAQVRRAKCARVV